MLPNQEISNINKIFDQSIFKQLFNVTSNNEEGSVLPLLLLLFCDFHLKRQTRTYRSVLDSSTSTYLIAIQAIDKCDTYVRSLDPNVLGEGGKHGGLHFNVSYALFIAFF